LGLIRAYLHVESSGVFLKIMRRMPRWGIQGHSKGSFRSAEAAK
jgi:hypothetical protein